MGSNFTLGVERIRQIYDRFRPPLRRSRLILMFTLRLCYGYLNLSLCSRTVDFNINKVDASAVTSFDPLAISNVRFVFKGPHGKMVYYQLGVPY